MINICQGKDPKQMQVLEVIELAAARAHHTRAIRSVLAKVHASVDVSGEMVAQAKAA